MSEETKFCTGCGCNLQPHMQYCPQCGKVVDGSAAMGDQIEFQKQIAEGRRNYLVFAIAIYAIPAIVFGIMALIESSYLARVVFENADFQKYLIEHHLNITQANLQTYFTVIAIMELLSGLCAAGTVFFVHKGENRKLATILCAVASVLCTWSIIGVFLGFLMTWSVYESADLFKDE